MEFLKENEERANKTSGRVVESKSKITPQRGKHALFEWSIHIYSQVGSRVGQMAGGTLKLVGREARQPISGLVESGFGSSAESAIITSG